MFSRTALRAISVVTLLSASVALGGCGTTQGDRMLSGGLLGAGTGALIGSVTGSAGKGALIGGLGGMAIGALTRPHDLNLGEPAWRRSASYRSRRTAARADEHCTTRETSTERITTCAKLR